MVVKTEIKTQCTYQQQVQFPLSSVFRMHRKLAYFILLAKVFQVSVIQTLDKKSGA